MRLPACGRMDATWYVRVIRVRTEDNRWRRPVSSPDPQVRAARNLADPPPENKSQKKSQNESQNEPKDKPQGTADSTAENKTSENSATEPTAADKAVRSRSRSRGPVVAITGAATGVGELLAARLAASEEIKQVIAIDERRGEVSEATWHILDVRDPAIAEKLRGADVVVHLALDLDLETDPAARTAYNVRGTQTVLTAAAAVGVHRVVLCTSAMVYGALPDNDIPLAEDAELRATAEATGVGDLLEIERLGRRAPRAHPGLHVTVVRPTVLVGGTDTALTRYFESPRLLVVAGSHPTWQFCHVDDLVTALEYAALEKIDGEFAVGCDGWLEQEEVEEISGVRRMELPSAVALGAAARLHRIGLTPSPAGDLAYTMHPWVVSVKPSCTTRAGARAGPTRRCSPRSSRRWRGGTPSPGSRLGRKDATAAGAAGATVALLGTAALVRRARKARRRI